MKRIEEKSSNKSSSTDWGYIRELETQLLQAISVQESLLQYQQLQTCFEWQIQQTADLYEANRRQALSELQDQLQKLADWQSTHGKSLPFDPKNTKASG